jgi:hypothetical protein
MEGTTSTFSWLFFDTACIQHANEITFVSHKWQSTTPNYHIPKVNIPLGSSLIVGYYTFGPIPILNPITIDSKLEHNQLLNHMEQLRILEQRPSHQSSSQLHVEPMEEVAIPIVAQ